MMWIFMISCIVLYLALPESTLLGLGVCNNHILCSFTYMFSHSSWLHLFMNVLSLSLIWRPICRLWEIKYGYTTKLLWLYCYLAAVLSGFICSSDAVTVGASGIIYFLLGVLLLLNPTLQQLKGYIWILVIIICQIYFGKSNVALHIVSFFEGVLLVIIKEAKKRLYEYRGIHKD